MTRPQLILVGLLLAAGIACAGPATVATAPIDWAVANQHSTVHVVTQDPDGDARVTRVWLIAVDGAGVIRTGQTRWWGNLQRDPHCRIRVDGVDYPVRVEPITDAQARTRIDAAFLAKYGWQERLFIRSDRAESDDNYIRLLPETG